jgi:hypothetical protein
LAFNIDGFRARGLVNGGARPSLFEVRLPIAPPGVSSTALNDLSFLVQASQLPSSVIEPIDVPYFGRKIKIAGDRTFQDWTITVMNDEDFGLRNFFESWHNKINSLVSNRQDSPSGSLLDYKVQAEVIQYGKAGPGDDSGIIRAYTFVGLFPTSIDAIGLDWERTNTYETFDVTFAYDYWVPSDFGESNDKYSPITSPDPTQSNGT